MGRIRFVGAKELRTRIGSTSVGRFLILLAFISGCILLCYYMYAQVGWSSRKNVVETHMEALKSARELDFKSLTSILETRGKQILGINNNISQDEAIAKLKPLLAKMVLNGTSTDINSLYSITNVRNMWKKLRQEMRTL